MAHRQALESGVVVGGDYEIERVLGAGGFGITYLAADKKLDTKVAIKEYFPASLAFRDDGVTVQAIDNNNDIDYEWGLERFLAEAQTLARLRHPNIVRVSRYFKENGTAYMVLGFVEGRDFETWLKQLVGRPTQAELDAIIEPLLDALAVVHAADVVHRDIKPENIYIRKSDGAPILLDFGAARQALGEQSRATASFVSPGYSPPESHLNDPKEQGPWTDIYGLAATLYRAVTGQPPAQVLARLETERYVPLAAQLKEPHGYRVGFLNAVDAGMRVKRQERPKDVHTWRKALFDDGTGIATDVKQPAATVVTKPGGSDAATVVHPPEKSLIENARPWAIGLVAAAIGLSGLYQIYTSFEPSRGPSAPPQRHEVAAPQQPQQPRVPAAQPQAPAAAPSPQPQARPSRSPASLPSVVPSTPAAPAARPSEAQPAREQTTPPDSGQREPAPKFDKNALLEKEPSNTDSPTETGRTPQADVTYDVYKNARFGFTFEFPSSLVTAGQPPANGGGLSFASADNQFRISGYAYFNGEGAQPRTIIDELRSQNQHYANADIVNVTSGALTAIAINNGRVRSATVITSCNNQVANVLELDFADREDFDLIARHIVESFKAGQGADTPTNCDPNAVATPSQPPAQPAQPTQPANPVQQDTLVSGVFGGDNSFRRLAVYGWSSAGFQRGLWSADVVGPNSTTLTLRCSLGPDARRDGSVRWQNLPTGNSPLTGQHRVDVQIGSYTDNAVLNFQSLQGVSTGVLEFSETAADAGNYLSFLRQLTNGNTMVLRIASIGYQETFSLHAADTALGPCFGSAVALGWTAQGERDGILSVTTRNVSGGAVLFRCDTRGATRGNAAMAFAARRSRNDAVGQTGSLVASVGSTRINIDFVLNPETDMLGGFFYHVVSQQGKQVIEDFLALLRRGNQLRLRSTQLGVDETFSLTGSSAALSGCARLY